jgi:predicted ArsR family transcriptional regulator
MIGLNKGAVDVVFRRLESEELITVKYESKGRGRPARTYYNAAVLS